MPNPTNKTVEEIIDLLYLARAAFQDIYVSVLRTYPAGTDERRNFILAKSSIDSAIVDLENHSLGKIANRMLAAQPDIENAAENLNADLEKLEEIQGASKKLNKALGLLEKALGYFI